MFIKNKYTKYYYQIINKAKLENRIKYQGIYYEKHHIIPKCKPFSGSNENKNLVLLTPREHFLCHWLLIKMCEGECRWKMQFALNRMLGNENNKKINKNLFSKRYFDISKKHQLEAIYSRAEINGFPMEGKKHTPEAKEKMRLAKQGIKRDPDKIGYLKERKHSDETKAKMSKALTGRVFSDESRAKSSLTQKGRPQNKTVIKCNVCGIENYATQIKRYHNDNCKKRSENV